MARRAYHTRRKAKKPLPHDGELSSDGEHYTESYGVHSFDSQADAGRGGPFGSAKILKTLLDKARAELEHSVPAPTFQRVILLTSAAEVPHSEEDDNKIEEALWELRSDIAQHTGLLSRETMAISLLVGFASLKFEFRHPGRPSAMLTACFFADAWHYWHMEVFGEHHRAYGGKLHAESQASATAARALLNVQRRNVVLQVIKDIFPAASNAECSRRLRTVNAALKERHLPPFPSEKALREAIRRLRQSLA
jgi:hypothetical protein